MGYSFGGPIIRDGLLFLVDAADRNSYPGSGTAWTDLSGNGNNGTLTNGPTFDNGASNKFGAINFDGSNDYVPLSSAINQTNHTISVWCNVTADTTHKYIVDLRDGSQDGVIIWSSDVEKISYRINDAAILATDDNYHSTHATLSHRWINIHGTYDGTTQKLYINGSLLKNQDIDKTVSVSQVGAIGAFAASPDYYFKGNIANVAIYNRALTIKEINQNFNAQKNRFGL